jgi:Tol biopolymer transport system component
MPSFAPDSGAIAFARENFTGLYTMDWQGNVSTVAEAPLSGWRYSWAPDGRNIAYRVRYGDTPALAGMVASRDGSTQTQVTDWQNDLYPPNWDKNGIGFKAGDDVMTVDEQGKVKSVKSLSDGRGIVSRAAGLSAAFFANNLSGATIAAFAALVPAATGKAPGKDVITNANNELWVVDENGESKKLLDVEGESGYASPQVAPTGDLVAAPGLSGQLYLANMRGGDPVKLGAGQNPTWSPDGKYLIYEVAKDDGHNFVSSDLWIASADGRWKKQLTTTSDIERYPSWSPDGRYVAYESDGKIFYAPVER